VQGDFDENTVVVSSRFGRVRQSMVAVAKRHELCPDDHVHEIAENNGHVADDAIGKQRAC